MIFLGEAEMKQFSDDLKNFIDKFMSEVDTDLHLTYKKQSTIMDQVEREYCTSCLTCIYVYVIF